LKKKPSNSLEVMEQKDYGKTVKLNIHQIAIRESIKSLEIYDESVVSLPLSKL
jgi:hypothetical protein